MANEISVSQLAGSIPDIVRREALKARYVETSILKHVMNADADVSNMGDRVSLSVMPSLSVNDVGTGGSVTRQQLSLTAVELVINKWKETTVDIDDQAIKQTALTILKNFSQAFGEALAAQQDADLAALHSDLTSYTVGDGTEPLSDTLVRKARLSLDKANIPQRDRFWILSPDGESDLLSQARFSEAQNTGFRTGAQIDGGRVTRLYGDPVYMSNSIVTSGGAKKNLYLHKEALGIGTQKNFKVTPLAKVQLSEAITGSILYGVKTIRASHGVAVNSANSVDV